MSTSFGIRVGRGLGFVGAVAVNAAQATGVGSVAFVKDVTTGAQAGYADARAAQRQRLLALNAAPAPAKRTAKRLTTA